MDSRQTAFVAALTEFTQIENLSTNTPIIAKRTNSVLGKTNIFACSKVEPHNYVLPLNVMWIDYNRTSLRYKRVLARVSKDPDPLYGTQHTWIAITNFDDMWYDHFYLPGEEPTGEIELATVDRIGIVTLTRTPTHVADRETPTVVSAEDPRNTNPRNPLPHDGMHPEIPARMLKTTGRTVVIDNGNAEANFSVIANISGDSNYRKLLLEEVHEVSPSAPALDPSTLNVPPLSGELYIPELTVFDRINGVIDTEARTFSITIKAFGASDPETKYRTYLGAYIPSVIVVRHEGVIQSIVGNSFVANQVGKYTIQATLVDINGMSSIQVEGAVIVVEE